MSGFRNSKLKGNFIDILHEIEIPAGWQHCRERAKENKPPDYVILSKPFYTGHYTRLI
jgi:hypothetical protein